MHNRLKSLTTRRKKKGLDVAFSATLSLLSLMFINASVANAQTQAEPIDWWFDVEIIAFKRTGNDTQISEDFSKAMFDTETRSAVDLFTITIAKDIHTSEMSVLREACLNRQQLPKDQALKLLMGNVGVSYEPPILDMKNASAQIAQPQAVQLSLPTICNFSNNSNYALLQISADHYQQTMLNSLEEQLFELPINVAGSMIENSNTHFLLPKSSFKMTEYATTLFKQRNIKPLLHAAWRQPVVFGEDNALFYRVISGERLKVKRPQRSYEQLSQLYADDYNSLVSDDANTADFFERLESNLNQLPDIDWLAFEQRTDALKGQQNSEQASLQENWELDGKVKVYLSYVNGVPYLHVDNEFMMHSIDVGDDNLAQMNVFPLKQRRRIISKQIHYFDHPKLGIVIRLERHERPKTEESQTSR